MFLRYSQLQTKSKFVEAFGPAAADDQATDADTAKGEGARCETPKSVFQDEVPGHK